MVEALAHVHVLCLHTYQEFTSQLEMARKSGDEDSQNAIMKLAPSMAEFLKEKRNGK